MGVCFNCNKDGHNLEDCPEPHNQGNIRRNRSAFIKKKVESERRYYIKGDEDNAKIAFPQAELCPGKLSEKLANALGMISPLHPPPYLRKMRQMGYPPGWATEPPKLESTSNTAEPKVDPIEMQAPLVSLEVEPTGDEDVDTKNRDIVFCRLRKGLPPLFHIQAGSRLKANFPGINVDPPKNDTSCLWPQALNMELRGAGKAAGVPAAFYKKT